MSDQSRIAELEEQLFESNKHLELVMDDMQKLKTASGVLRNRYAELLEKKGNGDKGELSSIIEEFKKRILALDEKLKEKSERCVFLESQLKQMEENAPQNFDIEQEEKYQNLLSENEQLKSDLQLVRIEHNNSKAAHDELSGEFIKLQDQFEELSLKHQQTIEEAEKNVAEDLELKLEAKMKELENIQGGHSVLKEEYETLLATNEQLRTMLSTTDDRVVVIEKERDNLLNDLKRKRQKNDKLIEQLKQLEAEFNKLEEENDKLSLKIESSDSAFDREQEQEKYEALKKERDDLWDKLVSSGNDQNSWREQFEKLDVENAGLRQQLKRTYLALFALQKEYSLVIRKIAQLKADRI